MDIAALLSTPIPSYFTLGPLVVVLILLLVLVSKRKPQSPGIATIPQAEVQALPVLAVAQLIQTPTMTPQPTAPVAQPVMAAPLIQTPAPQEPVFSAPVSQSSPVAMSTPVTTPAPVVEVVQEVPPPVPPISSWKPAQPVAMAPEMSQPVQPQPVIQESAPVAEVRPVSTV